MMDAKQAQKMTINGSKAAKRMKRCVEYLEKKILKAIQRGKWETFIHTTPDTPFFNPCYYLDEEERILIQEYLTKNLGFDCDNLNNMNFYKISWRPSNFKQIFMPCTEDSKLRHVVLAGQEPKVIIEDKNE